MPRGCKRCARAHARRAPRASSTQKFSLSLAAVFAAARSRQRRRRHVRQRRVRRRRAVAATRGVRLRRMTAALCVCVSVLVCVCVSVCLSVGRGSRSSRWRRRHGRRRQRRGSALRRETGLLTHSRELSPERRPSIAKRGAHSSNRQHASANSICCERVLRSMAAGLPGNGFLER